MSIDGSLHKLIFKPLWKIAVMGFVFLVFITVGMWYVYRLPQMPPTITPHKVYLEIPDGSSASYVAELLKKNNIIRSSKALLLSLKISGLEGSVKSGTYYFDNPEKLNQVIKRITSSDYNLPTKSVTLFEGEANYEYAKRLSQIFEYVSEKEFIRQSDGLEGYLFPDTYVFPERISVDEIIKEMSDNFNIRTKELQNQVNSDSKIGWKEIVTMASLIETEAGNADYATKRRVSGVLWQRMKKNMLLQADAVFSFIYKKHLPRVLYKHLEVDSPYNLYKHTGLPPGPIANPGIDSLRAALNPYNPEGYVYYLTGSDGKFYYAKTLARHEQNRRSYIKY